MNLVKNLYRKVQTGIWGFKEVVETRAILCIKNGKKQQDSSGKNERFLIHS
jgi:hypothetical protein